MRKIIEYVVISNHYHRQYEHQFIDMINKMIKEGWQPLGGVSLAPEKYPYAQAMVKYEDEPVSPYKLHTELLSTQSSGGLNGD